MEIEHNVFIDDDLIKSFTNSNWYDTATPYQFCITELIFLKHKIEIGKKLRIESKGKTYKINNLDEYKKWIESVFYGGFEKFVFETN
jgi:hypothetical protein